MLEGLQNGNNHEEERPAEEVPEAEKPATAEAGTDTKKLNGAVIKDGVMTVQIYLESSESAFACAIGSLVLAQDVVKNYFGKKAMSEAAAKARASMKIIVPGSN